MKNSDITRTWNAHWISAGFTHVDWRAPARPAPFFRKEFECPIFRNASIYICGLGYYELHLNGAKVGNHVLDPVPTQYDRRARYIKYDVTALLNKGINTLGVILGDGWYNASTSEVWHFDKAAWIDYPKVICELEIDGVSLLGTDESWKCLPEGGPIIFNALRNGEFYDARKELIGWNRTGYDDRSWISSTICPGPGGVLTLQTMPPCRVISDSLPKRKWKNIHGGDIYDMGYGISGWVKIKVRGETGTVVKLRYSELISSTGDEIDQSNINSFIKSGEVQTDRYILNGEGVGEWEPRFTYHGFNFVEVSIESGQAEVLEVIGRIVHTDFNSIGGFEASHKELTKLFQITRRSFVGNFVGIPTDCPHREKNGWTGDALIASDTGLFNFDLTESYACWLQSIADAQRPNGQLPGIVPTGGWGFNWGAGPVWDSAFIQIPYNIYIYRGDSSAIERNFQSMCRYLQYLDSLSNKNIIKSGLGDWCHHDASRMVESSFTSTAYYYWDAITMAKCAKLLACNSEAALFEQLANTIKTSFNDIFYHGNGIYAKGEPTALALALELKLCPETEREDVAKSLTEHMARRNYRADFGIIGAKYVPRALAANGYMEAAFQVVTQPEYPGWMNWLSRGAENLWEAWKGSSSRNHIMFGDVAAWMMQFLAGIVPDEAHPGFSQITLKPQPVKDISHVKAFYETPAGLLRITWWNENGNFRIKVSLPEDIPGHIIMPDRSIQTISNGELYFSKRC